MSARTHPFQWNFTIDRYVNPWLLPPPFGHLPQPVARFFGHGHSYTHPHARPPHGNLVAVFWGFVGAFCGIAAIEVTGRAIPSFHDHGAPLIIGSFGAAAVLEFYAIESPLAQPRNAVLGQLISAVVGVSISKLFALGPVPRSSIWTGGALACACATAVMALTGTVHPPSGATALLAVVDERVSALGWFLIPVMLLGCVLMQAVALVLNNIQRRFPLYWWTPEEVGQGWRRRRRQQQQQQQDRVGPSESGSERESKPSVVVVGHGRRRRGHGDDDDDDNDDDVEAVTAGELRVVVSRGRVVLPPGLELRPEELMFLEGLSQRLS